MTVPLHDVHVIAVADDLEMLGLLRAILEGAGAKVTTVATATAALRTINLLRPDVLVANLGMPMMDGFSLIHRVRHASGPPDVHASHSGRRASSRRRRIRGARDGAREAASKSTSPSP